MKSLKILCLALFLPFLAACAQKESPIEVSSVSLNTATIEMVEGETFNLVATVLPKDAEYDGITWASSNASVASVNSGTVTALKEGTATITASAGGKSSTCSVKVSSKVIPVTSVALDKTSLSIQVGETETLTATVNPADATDKNVIWTSSDESVAKVADGKVTAVKSGNAIITAQCGDKTAECAVTVTVPVASVSLDKTTLSLAVGESAQLTATVKPDDATDKTVIWSSSNASVATVSDGKVVALKSGQTTIAARSGNIVAECVVTVIVPVTGVTLDKTNITLVEGETATLIATVKPDNATDKMVVWRSSDESVVKVSDGEVSAIKVGVARIEVTTAGFSAYCDVTVLSPNNVIYYTAKDHKVEPFNKNAFGANIVSNEYSNGNGKIVFDAPVTAVGANAFYYGELLGGRNLETIKLPNTVSTIGDNAFYGSHTLTIINIPKGVTSIGKSAFEGCYELTSIDLPPLITTIEDKTFCGCPLSAIVLPEKLIKIGDGAFVNAKIQTIEFPLGLQSIGNVAFAGCALTKVIIPNSVVSIGVAAFRNCKTLASVEIDEGVTEIPVSCFDGCISLYSVKLPSSIRRFGYSAFENCAMLKSLYLKAVIPPTFFAGGIPFDSNTTVTIYVPRSSVDAYKAAEGWSKYKDNIKGYDF